MNGRIPDKDEMNQALKGRIGDVLYSRLSKAVVAVCGLGGLGSNIAVSLARAGVGKLILIDFDIVDISNLNRQQYKACQVGREKADALGENLKEISPYIDMVICNTRVTRNNAAKLLDEAEIVCEAFDRAKRRRCLLMQCLRI